MLKLIVLGGLFLLDKIFNINYYKFGFGHYWYGHNKRQIGIYCSLPSFIIVIILYAILSKGTIFGVLLIFIMDILFVPLTLLYLFFRLTYTFNIDLIDKMVIENFIVILICLLLNRFILNYLGEKFYNININSKQEFHNSPK